MVSANLNRRFRWFANVLVFMLALAFLATPVFHQIRQGWFTYSDYYLLCCSLLLFLAFFMPVVIRVNILFILLIIMLFEAALFAISQLEVKQGKQYILRILGDDRAYEPTSGFLGNLMERNENMGYQPKPGVEFVMTKQFQGNNQAIFEMTASIDEYHRRTTPGQEGVVPKSYAIFFGGSYTFGDGVNDVETLPYYFSSLNPQYRSYNYGFSGYGPQHMLARLQQENLRREVMESRGMGIYLFIDGHVKRAINSMTRRWVHNSPFYTLSSNGSLLKLGLFSEVRPYLHSLYHDYLLKSNILRYLNIDIPLTLNKNHIELTCRVVADAFNLYRKQMKNDNFYFVIHPDKSKRRLGQRLAPCIESYGVDVIDYTGRRWSDELKIEGDGHPSPAGHLELATWLTEDIDLNP